MTPNDVHEEIGTENLAKILGLTAQRVGQLTNSGALTKLRHGRYNLADAVQSYITYKLKTESDRLARVDTTPDQAVKIERARKLRLENDERERTLVDTGNAIMAIDVIVGPLQADLAGVPASVTDDVALRRQIEHAIHSALSGFSDRLEKAGAALRAGRDPDAADGEDDAG
jgi:translation elongation factor EF-Tu-like GTPase